MRKMSSWGMTAQSSVESGETKTHNPCLLVIVNLLFNVYIVYIYVYLIAFCMCVSLFACAFVHGIVYIVYICLFFVCALSKIYFLMLKVKSCTNEHVITNPTIIYVTLFFPWWLVSFKIGDGWRIIWLTEETAMTRKYNCENSYNHVNGYIQIHLEIQTVH